MIGLASPVPAASILPKAEPASQQQSDAQKQLSDIMKEGDALKRAGQLAQFIRDHPNLPELDRAYSALLGAFIISNPAKALALADEILAKYPDPNAPIHRDANGFKLYMKETDAGKRAALLEQFVGNNPDFPGPVQDPEETTSLAIQDGTGAALQGRKSVAGSCEKIERSPIFRL